MAAREDIGEKTEQPTQRKLEDALKKGQIPRSAEVQTVSVLLFGLLAVIFTGAEIWHTLAITYTATLAHLHEMSVSVEMMQRYFINNSLVLLRCAGPIVLAAMTGGLLAGAVQSRFQTSSEALGFNWEKLDPSEGVKRLFSMKSAVTAGIAILKLSAIIALTYNQILAVLQDPIFYATVSIGRVGGFLAHTTIGIITRVVLAMMVIAAIDYAYQHWRNQQDLMMTREEVKEENKNNEGNPQMRGRMRKQAARMSKRKALEDVRKADVVIVNPVRLAIALRYDRKRMRAPRIVAKGSRLNAQRIREIARAAQVPIVENKPLARMLFKYGKVGGEIPMQLYSAIAEILAWVYRVNQYRYYAEANQSTSPSGSST